MWFMRTTQMVPKWQETNYLLSVKFHTTLWSYVPRSLQSSFERNNILVHESCCRAITFQEICFQMLKCQEVSDIFGFSFHICPTSLLDGPTYPTYNYYCAADYNASTPIYQWTHSTLYEYVYITVKENYLYNHKLIIDRCSHKCSSICTRVL